MPDASFLGVDLVERQLEAAEATVASARLRNVSFRVGDATQLRSAQALLAASIDLIFGCEALCHMDSESTASAFMEQAAGLIRAGGRLVLVDGFRAATFDACPPG